MDNKLQEDINKVIIQLSDFVFDRKIDFLMRGKVFNSLFNLLLTVVTHAKDDPTRVQKARKVMIRWTAEIKHEYPTSKDI